MNVRLNVVYNTSDDFYEEGYTILRNKFSEVVFVKEKDDYRASFLFKEELFHWRNYFNRLMYASGQKGTSFKRNVKDILHSYDCPLVFFLTDDSVFVGDPFVAPEVRESIVAFPSSTMFSFRHGFNLSDRPRRNLFECGSYAHYRFDKRDSPHWTFKFSVDGHIYDREFVKKLSSKISYSNPNSFEAFLNTYSEKKNLFENILFNKCSSLVGFELNQVQRFSSNHSLNFSAEKLNDYFLKGYSLKYLYEKNTDFRPVLDGLEFANEKDFLQVEL
jgi:hypothetical protein